MAITFLLMFVDVHLPLLLETQGVDDSHSQSQGFPGVAMGTQGIDAGTCRWNMVCRVNREVTSGIALSPSHRLWMEVVPYRHSSIAAELLHVEMPPKSESRWTAEPVCSCACSPSQRGRPWGLNNRLSPSLW